MPVPTVLLGPPQLLEGVTRKLSTFEAFSSSDGPILYV